MLLPEMNKINTMEEPPEIRNIPLGVLSSETLKIVSMYLNPLCETLMPRCERVGDYRGLAELYGKSTPYIFSLEDKYNPTAELLKSLRGEEATLSRLWQHIRELGRTDLLEKCSDLFKRDTMRWHHRKPRDAFEAEEIKNEKKRSKIKDFFDTKSLPKPTKKEEPTVNIKTPEKHSTVQSESQARQGESVMYSRIQSDRSQQGLSHPSNSFGCPSGHQSGGVSTQSDHSVASASSSDRCEPIRTIDDVGSERPSFDAYINCAEEDIRLAKEMLNTLEAPPYNLRLFLAERQLMPGGSKYEDIAAVVEERCRGKVVIILTRNYENSEACQFVTNFARALDPASRNKQIIPISYEYVEVPRMLKGMFLIPKEKDEKRGWFWSKLKDAIKQ